MPSSRQVGRDDEKGRERESEKERDREREREREREITCDVTVLL